MDLAFQCDVMDRVSHYNVTRRGKISHWYHIGGGAVKSRELGGARGGKSGASFQRQNNVKYAIAIDSQYQVGELHHQLMVAGL
ncbi:hypothetical protein [Parasphingorhabdus sp.]|uniref:hypothetical protein n=1 Tax=Parasphingorhabdus sp. TaxID=2709688 RepID=UPI003A8CE1B5